VGEVSADAAASDGVAMLDVEWAGVCSGWVADLPKARFSMERV